MRATSLASDGCGSAEKNVAISYSATFSSFRRPHGIHRHQGPTLPESCALTRCARAGKCVGPTFRLSPKFGLREKTRGSWPIARPHTAAARALRPRLGTRRTRPRPGAGVLFLFLGFLFRESVAHHGIAPRCELRAHFHRGCGPAAIWRRQPQRRPRAPPPGAQLTQASLARQPPLGPPAYCDYAAPPTAHTISVLPRSAVSVRAASHLASPNQQPLLPSLPAGRLRDAPCCDHPVAPGVLRYPRGELVPPLRASGAVRPRRVGECGGKGERVRRSVMAAAEALRTAAPLPAAGALPQVRRACFGKAPAFLPKGKLPFSHIPPLHPPYAGPLPYVRQPPPRRGPHPGPRLGALPGPGVPRRAGPRVSVRPLWPLRRRRRRRPLVLRHGAPRPRDARGRLRRGRRRREQQAPRRRGVRRRVDRQEEGRAGRVRVPERGGVPGGVARQRKAREGDLPLSQR